MCQLTRRRSNGPFRISLIWPILTQIISHEPHGPPASHHSPSLSPTFPNCSEAKHKQTRTTKQTTHAPNEIEGRFTARSSPPLTALDRRHRPAMLQLQPPRFLPLPSRRLAGRRRRARPALAFNSQWKLPDVDKGERSPR